MQTKKVLKDGERLSVDMLMLDAQQRAVASPPTGQRTIPLSDEDRASKAKLYDGYDARLASAWVNPTPLVDHTPDAPLGAGATLADRYARRDRELENRWRGA